MWMALLLELPLDAPLLDPAPLLELLLDPAPLPELPRELPLSVPVVPLEPLALPDPLPRPELPPLPPDPVPASVSKPEVVAWEEQAAMTKSPSDSSTGNERRTR
jgi:hypothetical protein